MSVTELPIVPPTRRNGLPDPVPYQYRQPRPLWAVQALADAEILYGVPPGSMPIELYGETDIGPSYEWYREAAYEATDEPPPVAAPAQDGYCDGCGYLTSAIGHKITCGAS